MKAFFTIIWFLFSSILFANTIVVDKSGKIPSIQLAMNMAVNGDSILVYPGTYHEQNLVINKSICLLGIRNPILDGDNLYEIISIKANKVTIEGFTLVHSGVSSIEDYAGIKIYECSNVTIRNNILYHTFFGIYAQYAKKCLIEKNIIKGTAKEEQQSGNGIHCWKSDSMQVIGNVIVGHRDGIYFEFVTHSIIWRNRSYENMRYGLHFMFSNNNDYISNVFKSNGAGVAVMYSNHVKMLGNYFKENWGDAAYGLLLKEISDSYMDHNVFVNNSTGIQMEGASRIQMEKNQFLSNGWAFRIQASCMDIILTRNNFIANTFDIGTNGNLVLNTFDHNYWDKYEGYDLNKDGVGDFPYRPVSVYAMIIEMNPPAVFLFRSLITSLLDKSEKMLPALTPENLKDNFPLMNKLVL